MDYNLIFNKILILLGLDPGEYKLSFTAADQIKDLGAGFSDPLGLACGTVKTIWAKDSLSELETVKVILHEARHLQQFKQGHKYPEEKDWMENDATEYASKNLIELYILGKFGKVLSGMDFIKAGLELIRTL